jgi:hypothetical protein
MTALRSEEYAKKVCKALGIESNRVRRILIDAKVGDVLRVYVEYVGVSEIMDIDLPFADKTPEVTLVNGTQ